MHTLASSTVVLCTSNRPPGFRRLRPLTMIPPGSGWVHLARPGGRDGYNAYSTDLLLKVFHVFSNRHPKLQNAKLFCLMYVSNRLFTIQVWVCDTPENH